jgi:hypothetical protein
VVVSYLPVGSEQATKWYVEQILEAGCGFVNCIPVFIAREDYWNKRFKKAGLPIVGDDIKSQVGATIVHRTLARLFHDRGVKLLRTSQLNVGGNMDFYNMLERERLESKKISKTNAVTSIMGHTLPADDVHVGPSDYVPWLTDRKWAHIRLEGQAFGDVPLNLELKLEVWDSPNSAGIVIDAVRCCKLALEHGLSGQLDGPSSYLMKSPMHQRPDDEARELTERSSPSTRAPASWPAKARRGAPRQSLRRPVACRPARAGARAAPRHRAGDAVRLGGAERGQRVRRARLAGAGAARAPRGRDRAVELAGARARQRRAIRGARASTPSAARAGRRRAARARRRRGAAVLAGPAARGLAAGRRGPHDRGGAHGAAAGRRPRARAVRAERRRASRCATRAR